jgi:hypothetical protein
VTITGTLSHKIQRESLPKKPIAIPIAEKQRPAVPVNHQRVFPRGIRRDETESQGHNHLLITKQGLNCVLHLSLEENVARLMIIFMLSSMKIMALTKKKDPTK